MLPQALLFSSDQQVAEIILALLPELGMEVEHCADVFGAVQRITGRSYQLLVIDWKEHLEASFLLKTARELTVTKATPAVALVEQTDVAAALKVGADAVLVKPFSFDQARSTMEALPQVSRKQPSPPKNESRQTLAAPSGESRIGLGSTEPSLKEKLPARAARPIVSEPLRFAGYAHDPQRPSRRHLKRFLMAGCLLGGIGLSVPAYHHMHEHWRYPVQFSFVRPAPVPNNATDSTAFDAEAIAEAAMSNRLTDSHRHFPRHPGGTRAMTQGSAGRDAGGPEWTAALAPNAAQPVIPDSLTVPVLAMTSAAAPTKPAASHRPNWLLEPVLLSEDASRALLVQQVTPKYPQTALAAGIQGTVLLHALIGKDGCVRDLKLIEGPLVFGRSAVEAVRGWRYRPYRLNGEIVEMQTFITVNFSRSHNTSLAQTRP